jgi:hypothetical protein
MFDSEVIFRQVFERLEYHGLSGWVMARKLSLVYAPWWVIFLFVAAAVVGVAVLVQTRRHFRQAVPLWTIPLLCLYCALGGMFFFNQREFLDLMPYPAIPPMLRSLITAVVPIAILHVINRPESRAWKEGTAIQLALIPLVHLIMTVVYVFLSSCIAE